MHIKTRLMAALVAFFVCVSESVAATIISPGSTWEYTFDHGATWSTGKAPFGNNLTGDFGYQNGTYWAENAPLTVRASINLSGFDLSSLQWYLGVDNGYEFFVNDKSISAHNAEGYTSVWEYSGSIAASDLKAGVNQIVIDLEDHGGATAFDFLLTGNRCEHQVADGVQSFGLLLGSLALLAGLKRRLS